MKSGGNTLQIHPVIRIMGRLIILEALMMILPLVVCFIYGEDDWKGFAIAIICAIVVGATLEISTRRVNSPIKNREGFVITAFVWIVFGCFGAIPLMLCRNPLNFTDAYFEIISGFTTTGASVIPDVGIMSHGILFWRAFTQWIGGLGIILFMLALLPEFNKSVGISMFNAEATGIVHGKLHPRIRQTALSLWGVYAILTIVSIILLWAGPMNLFDAVCQTFATVATGGFTTHSNGLGFWHSDYVYIVMIAVMFVAGLNFLNIFLSCKEGIKILLHNDVFKAFAAIIGSAYFIYLLSALMTGADLTLNRLFVYPLFHVMSAITSTGFSINEVETWGPVSLLITILLMICGSCTGSTTGGIKVDRLLVLSRNFRNEIQRTVFPKRTYIVRLGGTPLDPSIVSRIYAFVSLYMLFAITATLITTFFGYSVTDSFFMSFSCIGCNGLGYGATGCEGGFASLPSAIKWMQTALMLIGRLELFTFFVLFIPSFWKR